MNGTGINRIDTRNVMKWLIVLSLFFVGSVVEAAFNAAISIAKEVTECGEYGTGKVFVIVRDANGNSKVVLQRKNAAGNWVSVGTASNVPNNGQAAFDKLEGGVYRAEVRDKAGEGTLIYSEEKNVKLSPTGYIAHTKRISCSKLSDGTPGHDGVLDVAYGGGMEPLSFRCYQSDGTEFPMDGNIARNLPEGEYYVVIYNADGSCPFTTNKSRIWYSSDISIYRKNTVTADCEGMGGSASVVATGALSDSYTYTWSDATGEVIKTETRTTAIDDESTLDNVLPGTYNVSVTNDKNCYPATDVLTIKPKMIEVKVEATRIPECEGEEAQFTVRNLAGASSYLYSLDGSSAKSEVKQGDVITVTESVHSIRIEDALTAACYSDTTIDFTHKDNIQPSITVQGFTANVEEGKCEITIQGTSYDASATDNCSIKDGSLKYTVSINGTEQSGVTLDGVTFPKGEYTVEWTVEDVNGNQTTKSQAVSIKDNQKPIISGTIENQELSDGASCSFTMPDYTGLIKAITTDNCGTDGLIFSQTPAVGTQYTGSASPQNILVTVTVADASGNSDGTSFTVTIPAKPTVKATVTKQVTCAGGNDGEAQAEGSGIGLSYSWTDGLTGIAVRELYAKEYTVVATDENGCTASSSVKLEQPEPVVAALSVIQPSCAGEQGVLTFSSLTGGSANYSYSLNDGEWLSIQQGESIAIEDGLSYKIDVKDGNGCPSSTISGNVGTINNTDVQAPELSCPSSVELSTSLGSCNAVISNETYDAVVTSENCSVVSLRHDWNAKNPSTLNGAELPKGVSSVTWTAMDGSGNVATCVSTYNVVDKEAPTVVNMPNLTTYNCAIPNIERLAEHIRTYASDNCTETSKLVFSNQSILAGKIIDGTTTLTVDVADEAGNSITVSVNVQLPDAHDAIKATLSANTDKACLNGDAVILTFGPVPLTSDAVEHLYVDGNPVSLSSSFLPSSVSVGTHKITYEIAAYGCTRDASVVVTVNPNPSVNLVATNACPGNPVRFEVTTSATVPTVEWIVNDNVDVSQTGLSYSHVASTAAGTSVTASVVVLDNTNGCKSSRSPETRAEVYNVPLLKVSPEKPAVCVYEKPVHFTTSFSDGLSYVVNYSGEGVTGETFDPSIGSGNHVIHYTSQPYGCTIDGTTSVMVNERPSASITTSDVCEGATLVFDISTSAVSPRVDWTVNNKMDGTESSTILSIPNASGIYNVIAVVTDDLTGCLSEGVSADASALTSPELPTVTDYETCQTWGRKSWNSLITNLPEGASVSWYSDEDAVNRIPDPGYIDNSKPQHTTYYVRTTLDIGCLSAENSPITAIVHENPVILSVKKNDDTQEVELTVDKGMPPYHFTYGNVSGDFTVSTINLGRLAVGTRALTVTDDYGCRVDTAYTVSSVEMASPTFFTPNGDGNNDMWMLTGMKWYPDSRIIIMDRYGKVLLDKKGQEFEGWDGTYNGEPVVADTYWYLIEARETGERKIGHFLLKR